MTIENVVKELARRHGVRVETASAAYINAVAFNRLEGIVGDETVDLIAALMSKRIITTAKGIGYIVAHKDELNTWKDNFEKCAEGGDELDVLRSIR